jgi:hypothetical protein
MLEVLETVCRRLDALGIPYMLSGSLAFNVYAVPRMTQDIDLVLAIEGCQVDAFHAAFAGDFFIDELGTREEVRRKGMFNLVHKRTGTRLDCIVRKEGRYRQAEFERRMRLDMGGFEAWVVSLEDLILSKLLWIQELQSEKQQADIRQLLETGKADDAYLLYWIETLKIRTFGLI